MERETVIRTLVADRAKLLAFAWSILRDHHTTEDLYQDVIIAAVGQVETFNDRTHLLKWSRATLRNKALEYLRRQRSSPVTLSGDVLELLDSHWNEHDACDSVELTDALRGCLASLTSNARQLIELRFGQGLPGTEVAAATDRKPHTIYVALSRAYKSLAQCINSRLGGENSHA